MGIYGWRVVVEIKCLVSIALDTNYLWLRHLFLWVIHGMSFDNMSSSSWNAPRSTSKYLTVFFYLISVSFSSKIDYRSSILPLKLWHQTTCCLISVILWSKTKFHNIGSYKLTIHPEIKIRLFDVGTRCCIVRYLNLVQFLYTIDIFLKVNLSCTQKAIHHSFTVLVVIIHQGEHNLLFLSIQCLRGIFPESASEVEMIC